MFHPEETDTYVIIGLRNNQTYVHITHFISSYYYFGPVCFGLLIFIYELFNINHIYFNEIKRVYNFNNWVKFKFCVFIHSFRSIRFIAQSIFYEIRFVSIIFCLIISNESYPLGDFVV